MVLHPESKNKVKMRFVAVADIEIFDKLMMKESEKQVLKRPERRIRLVEEGRSPEEKIGSGRGPKGRKVVQAVGCKVKSGKANGGKKTRKQLVSKKKSHYEDFPKERGQSDSVLRTPEEDGDMRARGEVKLKENYCTLDSFLPNPDFSCFSNFTVWVPKQHQKRKEKVSHLPPLPDESALFHSCR